MRLGECSVIEKKGIGRDKEGWWLSFGEMGIGEVGEISLGWGWKRISVQCARALATGKRNAQGTRKKAGGSRRM